MMTTAVQHQQLQLQLQQQHSKELKTNVVNNDDNNIVEAVTKNEATATPTSTTKIIITATTATSTTTTTTTTCTSLADISGLLSTTSASIEKSLATMELQYFKAVSLYRRRNYEKCVEVCNAMLQAGHENNVQMFNTPPDEEENDNATVIGGSGGGVSGGGSEELLLNNNYGSGGIGAGVSNNSSTQRYSSNLQRMAIRQGGRQRGIYGNNVSSVAAVNGTAAATTAAASHSATNCSSSAVFSILPTWMMEGVWQLKMRALTQRIYIDDLETNDADDAVNEEVEFERIATAARPGTSIKSAFLPRPSTSNLRGSTAASLISRKAAATAENPKQRISTSGLSRPTSAMARPGTSGLSRPGSSLGSRPTSGCATASRVRATSAAAFNIGDATAALYQASRINPTIYAERKVLVKALFQFLYYHEADVLKAYSLCEAVMEVHKQQHGSAATVRSLANCDEWWWQQQMGRCLLAQKYPRKAEVHLHLSLNAFPHPDTYILLARLYQRLQQPEKAMDLIQAAVDKHPFDITFRVEQGRLLDAMSKLPDAMQMYRLISKLNPINIEALACIALNYFYDNNPEMALMYYRRILSLGVYSAELYCNIALCCLYGGQIDLVLPCFQRALAAAKSSEQKADIWYNMSFVAITTGDFNLAKRCLQLSLTADARNGAALNNLAVLATCTGDILKAKSYLNAAKDVWDDSVEIEINLKYMSDHYKL